MTKNMIGWMIIDVPPEAKRALSLHITNVIKRIDCSRFSQEPQYVAALFGRLDAMVYESARFSLELRSTIVDDRGRGSAESNWGADFALVASITQGSDSMEKAVLGQAKRGSLTRLSPSGSEKFRIQAVKMSRATSDLIGLEVPTTNEVQPTVRIIDVPKLHGNIPIYSFDSFLLRHEHTITASNAGPPVALTKHIPLGQYIYARLLRCIHGDIRPNFVQAVSDSKLTKLTAIAHA